MQLIFVEGKNNVESLGENTNDTVDISKLSEVKQKLKLVGINCDDSCIPGRYAHLLCPKVLSLCVFQY